MVSNVTETLHFILQRTQLPHKKYHFLNINPSNMIVLKFHMLLIYIYHQTVSKQYFLVGECMYQIYVYFQALRGYCTPGPYF